MEWRLFTLPRAALLAGTFAAFTGLALQRRNLAVLGLSLLAWLILARLRLPDFGKLRASRSHTERTFEGETLRVSLRLDPARRVGEAHYLEAQDEFSAGDGVYVRALLETAFAGGNALELVYRPRCQRARGLYVLGPLQLAGTDPTGLLDSTALIDHFTNLLVYPKAALLQRFDPLDNSFTTRHMGERTHPVAGFGQEFHEVREYRPGDNPRHIHWPVSARHGKLFVKAFEDCVMTEVSIFVDLGRFARAGLGDITSEEMAVSAAAAIATRAIEQSHMARLYCSSEKETDVPLGAGPNHLYALLNALALARSGGSRDFAAAIRPRAMALHRGGVAALVATSTSIDEALELLVAELVQKGLRVVMVVVDDKTYHSISLEQQLRQAEARSARDAAIAMLARGAEVFTLAKGADLRRELERAGLPEGEGR